MLFTGCSHDLHNFFTWPCDLLVRMQASSTYETRSRPNPAFLITALAGLILASGCVIGPPSIVQVRPAAWKAPIQNDAPAQIRVTTFNVWGLPTWLNRASSDRYARMARELDEQSPDVVLLQEVWTKRCFAELSGESNGLGRAWWAASARHKGTFLGQNGLLTLSRFPIVGTEVRHFSSAGLPDSLMHKGALKVTVEIRPGQRYNIWNVHLQDGGAQRVRSHQLAELIQWVDQANDGQGADLVGGDFNFTPDSSPFSQFASAIGHDIQQLAGDSAFPTWDALKAVPGAG